MMDYTQVPLLRQLVALRSLTAVEARVAAWWWSVDRRPNEPFPAFLFRKGLLPADASPALSRDPIDPATTDPHLRAGGWVAELKKRAEQIAGGGGGSSVDLTTPTHTPLGLRSGDHVAPAATQRPKPAVSPQVGATIGKCLLTERLGQGGTGLVFRALHQSLNIPVAVKILRPQVLAADPTVYHRFKSEACLLAQLNHPNLVRIWDLEDDPEFPFLTLEFVEGLSLAELIQQSDQVRFDRALHVVTQVAEGLQFALRHGVIHRDVKPSNVLITKDGTVKIADLGLAVVLGDAAKPASARPELLGTPAYMAPEQAQSPHDVDHRADIYALGSTFYHTITGSPPFGGASKLQVMYRHISEDAPPPHERVRDLPPEASAVILRMMAKRPEDRYRDYESLLEDLRRLGKRGEAPPRVRARAANPFTVTTSPGLKSGSSADLAPEMRAAMREGIEFARAGDREKARERLRTVTLLDPTNEVAWLWLAGVCESPAQTVACLERVLAINPENGKAFKALASQPAPKSSPVAVAPEPAPPVSVFDTPQRTDTDTHSDLVLLGVEPGSEETVPDSAPPSPLVLLIDPVADSRAAAAAALEVARLTVASAGDLAAALDVIGGRAPAIVVLDPDLTDGDGYDFVRTLPGVAPLIALSNKNGFMDKMRARAAGVASVLPKPFDAASLAAALRSLAAPG